MSEQVEVDLIVKAIAEGFDKLAPAINDGAKAADKLGDGLKDAGNKAKGAEDKGKSFADKFKGDMRGLNDALNVGKFAMQGLGDAIDASRAAAERLGRTGMIDAFDKAESAAMRFGDTLFTLPIGNMIPVMSLFGDETLKGADALEILERAANGLSDGLNTLTVVGIQVQAQMGQITWEDAAAQVDELTGAVSEQVAAQQSAADATNTYALRMTGLAKELAGTGTAQNNLNKYISELHADDGTEALRLLGDVADATALGMGKLTEEIIFSQIAKTLDAETALRMGVALGVVDAKNADLVISLGKTREAYDSNKDGFISAEEAAAGYTQAVIEQTNAFTGQLEILRQIDAELAKPRRAGGATGDGYDEPARGPNGDGYAAGGSFIVPPGYPNDSYPMRVQSGERVIVQTPAQQAQGGQGGANWTFGDVIINAQPGQDGAALWRDFSAQVAARTRANRSAGVNYGN